MKFAVLGTGIMGRGWITQFAMNGHDVHCFDANTKGLTGVIPGCEKMAASVAKKFKNNDPDFIANTTSHITIHKDKDAFIAAVNDCDVFLEAIFEDLKLKCTVLADYMPQLSEKVVLWSNTSSLDIDPMADACGRPDRAIVTHGMNPVPLMSGVEVVPGAKTSAKTVEFTRQTLLDMKKSPFLAPNIPGFWVNRLLMPQMLDAVRLLEQGKIKVEDGDIGLNTSLGHPQGTFKLHDFVTAPTMLRVALQMYQASNDPRLYPPLTLMRMVQNGEHGASTGKGFYDWSDPRNPKARDVSHYVVDNVDDMVEHIK